MTIDTPPLNAARTLATSPERWECSRPWWRSTPTSPSPTRPSPPGAPGSSGTTTRRVVELEPKDPFSYTALSVACMRAGLIPEAEDALARSRMLQG